MQEGEILFWDDKKGFGFVGVPGQSRVFFHISDLRTNARPSVGDKLFYRIVKGADGKPKAVDLDFAALGMNRAASFTQDKRRGSAKRADSTAAARAPTHAQDARGFYRGSVPWLQLGVLLLLPLLAIVSTWRIDVAGMGIGLGQLMAGALAAFSAMTYFLYAHDKRCAQRDARRVPEKTLHLLAAAGGWPGAFVAQQQFRHKTKKLSFRAVFWLIVAAHQLLALDYIWFDGRFIVSSVLSHLR